VRTALSRHVLRRSKGESCGVVECAALAEAVAGLGRYQHRCGCKMARKSGMYRGWQMAIIAAKYAVVSANASGRRAMSARGLWGRRL